MKVKNITNAISNGVKKSKIAVKNASPEILLVVGAVGIVSAAVMACISSTKVKDTIDDGKKAIDDVHERFENEDISENEFKTELTKEYIKTGVSVIKLYWLPTVLGVASLTALVGSNIILKRRVLALSSAYMTLDESFKKYRNAVVSKFGEAADQEMRFSSILPEKKENDISEDADSEKKEMVKPLGISDYARFFDESNPFWTKDPIINRGVIDIAQRRANDRLLNDGIVTLNDVYDILGFPRTRAGQVVGWRYDKKHPTGDNYISFGLENLTPEKIAFMNGYENVILLDFNVDGIILNYIPEY